MRPENFMGNNLLIMMDKFRQNIKRYKEIGMQIRIVEFFVSLDKLGDTEYQRLKNQARIMYQVFKVGLEEGAEVGLYLPWDADDAYTYPPYQNNTLPYVRDKGFRPLPSYYSILAAFLSR